MRAMRGQINAAKRRAGPRPSSWANCPRRMFSPSTLATRSPAAAGIAASQAPHTTTPSQKRAFIARLFYPSAKRSSLCPPQRPDNTVTGLVFSQFRDSS